MTHTKINDKGVRVCKVGLKCIYSFRCFMESGMDGFARKGKGIRKCYIDEEDD